MGGERARGKGCPMHAVASSPVAFLLTSGKSKGLLGRSPDTDQSPPDGFPTGCKRPRVESDRLGSDTYGNNKLASRR